MRSRGEGDDGGPYIVAAAAEAGEQKLLVFGDPVWALDQITTYGVSLLGQGPGAAVLPGGRFSFPANAELFVNGVYWLADLSELIAASPRTQEVRRVEPMTDSTWFGIVWTLLLGMPLAVLVIGVSVFLVRRRG